MAVSCFQRTDGALQTKHLLNALPVLAKPVVEIRATDDLAVFQSSLPFVPGFGLLPSSTISSAAFKHIPQPFFNPPFVAFVKPHIVAFKPMNLCTQGSVRMHGVQAQDASFHHRRA